MLNRTTLTTPLSRWLTARRTLLVGNYLIAVGATAASLALTVALPDIVDRPFFLFFLAGIVFSAWFGGFLPGLLATGLSGIAATYYVIPPQHTFAIADPYGGVRLVALVVTGVVISGLVGALRAAKDTLAVNDLHFRRAQVSGDLAAFTWNLRTGRVNWSEQLSDLRDLPGEDTVEGWRRYVHPEDLGKFEAATRRALEEGADFDAEGRLVLPDGKMLWVSSRGEVLRDENGVPAWCVGVLLDITERKRTEQRLALQEAVTRALAESDSLEQAAPQALEVICEKLSWAVGCIWTVDRGRNSLCLIAVHEHAGGVLPFAEATRNQRLRRGMGLPGQVWESGESMWLADVTQERDFARSDAALASGLHSGVAFPIRIGSDVVGVIEFFHNEKRKPDDELLQIMLGIGSEVGQFIERQHAEAELRDSEQRYRTVAETASDAIFTVDEEGTILFANPAVEKIFGYKPEEVIGQPLKMLMPVDMRGQHSEGMDRYLRTGERRLNWHGVELPGLRRDGQTIPLEMTFGAFVEAGRHYFTGFARDISQRKQSEQALRETEEWLITTLSSIGDAVIATDVAGRVQFMNPVAQALTGWKHSEASGRPLNEIFRTVNEFSRQPTEDPVAEVMRTGNIVSLSNHSLLIARDGREVPIADSGAPIRTETGGAPIGVVLVFRDVSERKAAERTMVQLAAIVQFSDDAIFSKDMKAIITSWNHGAEKIYGYTPDEIVGRSVTTLVPAGLPDEIPQIMARLSRGEAIEHYETRRKRKDGTIIDVSLTISPIRDPDGRVVAASTIARDITERKRAEEALRASEKLAATGRLAASIAHEINNPMESVGNLLYLVARQEALDENSRHYIELAQQELTRMAHIVRQTLGFHREAATPVRVKMSELLDGVLDLYGRKITQARVTVERRYEDEGLVEVFPGEMRQVLANLVVNAVEAMGAGGKICLHIFRARDWAHSERTGIRVVVADTGPGIAIGNRRKIFEPFFTTKGEKGTGLGLWVSSGIVQKHHGSIHFRSTSEPGHSGTVFSIFLPAEPVAEHAMTEIHPAA